MKNILLIITDQQRKDSLGCYGNPIVQTPNIDRLATQGIRFNRNYVANPICMPNRLSIFTGQCPRNHGMWTNGLYRQRERRTIATHLASHGYQTASFGKLHFTPYGGDAGNWESANFWQAQGDDFDWYGPYWGFDHVELTIGHTRPLAHYGRWFRQNGGTPEMLERHEGHGAMQSGVRKMPAALHDSTFVGERTAAFIRTERDARKPFFAVASFPDPHHPFDPPEEIAKLYSPDNVIPPVGVPADLVTRPPHYQQHFRGGWHRSGTVPESRPYGIPEAQQNEMIAHTYAMVDLIDRGIGTILKVLDEQKLWDDTIVIFTSDHGELLGDHGLWLKGPFFYEGLINTPLIIAAPRLAANGISDALFSDVDLAPTICELVGQPVPLYMDGHSQLPHLLDPTTSTRDQCMIEYRNGYGTSDVASRVLVTDTMKYVRYANGESELTDLRDDPREQENRVAQRGYADTVHEMQSRLLDEVLTTEPKWPEQIALA